MCVYILQLEAELGSVRGVCWQIMESPVTLRGLPPPGHRKSPLGHPGLLRLHDAVVDNAAIKEQACYAPEPLPFQLLSPTRDAPWDREQPVHAPRPRSLTGGVSVGGARQPRAGRGGAACGRLFVKT